jgi:hypothetical protein
VETLIILGVVLVVVVFLAWGGYAWVKTVKMASRGAWRQPSLWVYAVGAALLITAVSWTTGMFSQAWDLAEDCARHGQTVDESYQEHHLRDAHHWFPLHSRCNAHYDLVPAWVNPAIVISAAAAGAFMVTAAVVGIRNHRKKA